MYKTVPARVTPAGFADPIEYAGDHFKSAINSRDPINETPLKPPNFHKRFASSFSVHYTNHFRKLFKGGKKLLTFIHEYSTSNGSLQVCAPWRWQKTVQTPWAWFVKCFVPSPQTASSWRPLRGYPVNGFCWQLLLVQADLWKLPLQVAKFVEKITRK